MPLKCVMIHKCVGLTFIVCKAPATNVCVCVCIYMCIMYIVCVRMCKYVSIFVCMYVCMYVCCMYGFCSALDYAYS